MKENIARSRAVAFTINLTRAIRVTARQNVKDLLCYCNLWLLFIKLRSMCLHVFQGMQIGFAEFRNTYSAIEAFKIAEEFFAFQQRLRKQELGWFCPLLFNHIYCDSAGVWKPCCRAVIPSSIESWWGLRTETHTPFQYFRANQMDQLRKEMISGNLDKVRQICALCLNWETKGWVSSRQRSLAYVAAIRGTTAFALFQSVRDFEMTGMFKPHGRNIELSAVIFGNYCNLKCYMCHPQNSSSRITELNNIDRQQGTHWLEALHKMDSVRFQELTEPRFAEFVNDISREIDNVDAITIFGGEPLVMPKHYAFLDSLISTGQTHKVKLKYVTNLAKLSDGNRAFLEYARRFREVIVNISVCGIGDKNEYIRYGSNWKQFLTNLDCVLKAPQIKVQSIGYTTSILNVFDVLDTLKYFRNRFGLNVGFGNIVVSPKFLCAQHLPDQLKQILVESYQKSVYSHRLHRIIGVLKEPRDEGQFRMFIKYMRALDRHRGTDFTKIWPQFKPYM